MEIDYDEKKRTPAQELYRAYSKWAKENREYEMSSKKFFSEVSKKLPEKGRDGKGVYFKYIRITNAEKQYSISDFTEG